MRNTLVNLIHQEAKKNKDLYFITADLGYSVIDDFIADCPEQCLNIGICEQNMIGVAAGMALKGKKVFVYSIVPFVTMRCFEQIRVDVCYQNLDVTVVGVGGGFAYGSLGPTHHAIEDIAVMSSLPNMKVVSMADPTEVKKLYPSIIAEGGPTYIRLNRGGEPTLIDETTEITFKKGTVVRKGTDISLISTGQILQKVLEVAEKLEADGISTEVISMHCVKPLDTELVKDRCHSRKAIFSIEEHNVWNGLGSAVASVVAEEKNPVIFKKIGIPDRYTKQIGNQDFLREHHNLSTQNIYQLIKESL